MPRSSLGSIPLPWEYTIRGTPYFASQHLWGAVIKGPLQLFPIYCTKEFPTVTQSALGVEQKDGSLWSQACQADPSSLTSWWDYWRYLGLSSLFVQLKYHQLHRAV